MSVRISILCRETGSRRLKDEERQPERKERRERRRRTSHDVENWEIPEGYATRNWDPLQRPLLLLGSVFDGNSLGKWIYDWTVYCYGPRAPMADVAAELWLLLITMAGRERIVRENEGRVGSKEEEAAAREVAAGLRALWAQLIAILASCEGAMKRVGKRDAKGERYMDLEAGVAFVQCMFGRDYQLGPTEELMNGIRTWKMDADMRCAVMLNGRQGAW